MRILIFDFLIGNTDRHQNNWAIIQSEKNNQVCPVYDNSSSLCCYIQESQIDSFLGNDKIKFEALVNSKSTSRVRLDKKMKKEPKQLEVLEYLKNNYYQDVVNFIKTILDNIDQTSVNNLLGEYTEDIVSKKRKILIQKFLMAKINLISELFNL